ncbi:MAG: hypothetical protein SW833_16910 [Cyanobacteriota bacterium]|nr:hypothetical protein [Cyanobacteriota bacterium]
MSVILAIAGILARGDEPLFQDREIIEVLSSQDSSSPNRASRNLLYAFLTPLPKGKIMNPVALTLLLGSEDRICTRSFI